MGSRSQENSAALLDSFFLFVCGGVVFVGFASVLWGFFWVCFQFCF